MPEGLAVREGVPEVVAVEDAVGDSLRGKDRVVVAEKVAVGTWEGVRVSDAVEAVGLRERVTEAVGVAMPEREHVNVAVREL